MPTGSNPKSKANLKKISEKTARSYSKKSHSPESEQKRRDTIKKNQTMQQVIKELLDSVIGVEDNGEPVTAREAIVARAVKDAIEGNAKAREFIRDTAGEKPADKIEVFKIDPETFSDVEEMIENAKAGSN